mgnify:FL=1|jgi:hypothetical protein|tara:strand:- start:1627 stop:2343 length:717 start_codon:yes stop_codon:yes gene_type:complete
MRILILSVPFLGVEEIGKAISLDLGYTNFVSDPMNLDFYGTTIRHYYHNGDEIVYMEGGIERPYIYPNDVPDNSVFTHYVGHNKLPGNLTEDEFLSQWGAKFDKIVAIKSNNLEIGWKRWCSSGAQEDNNNVQFEMYHKQHCGKYLYEDSHFDQAIVDKLTTQHTLLENYILSTGITAINAQDIVRQLVGDEAISGEELTLEFNKLNIGLGDIGTVDENGDVNNLYLWMVTRGGLLSY